MQSHSTWAHLPECERPKKFTTFASGGYEVLKVVETLFIRPDLSLTLTGERQWGMERARPDQSITAQWLVCANWIQIQSCERRSQKRKRALWDSELLIFEDEI